MKKYLIIGAVVSAISAATLTGVSFAEVPVPIEKSQSLKNAKYEQKLADWNKLSKADKLKQLNDKQAAKIKASQARWAKLSDDQKISRYENGMKRGHAMSTKNAEYRAKCNELMGKKK